MEHVSVLVTVASHVLDYTAVLSPICLDVSRTVKYISVQYSAAFNNTVSAQFYTVQFRITLHDSSLL